MSHNRFGKILRAEREGSKLSLRSFSRLVEISPTYLSFIECGKSKPTKELAIKIANQLGMCVDLFVIEAGYIPDDLIDIFRREPVAISELMRAAHGLSFSQIESLIQMVREMKSNGGA